MRLNKIQIESGNVYLIQKGFLKLLILSFILLYVFIFFPFLNLKIKLFSIYSAVFLFFGLLTLYVLIINLYQHIKYGGTRWIMLNNDLIKITFTHYVDKDFFKWDEIEKIIYAKRIVSKGKYGKESHIPNAVTLLIKNNHHEKQVYDISSFKCSVDSINPNMLHYSPENKNLYLVVFLLSENITRHVLNWIKDFSKEKTNLIQTETLKLDYKNNKIEL